MYIINKVLFIIFLTHKIQKVDLIFAWTNPISTMCLTEKANPNKTTKKDGKKDFYTDYNKPSTKVLKKKKNY